VRWTGRDNDWSKSIRIALLFLALCSVVANAAFSAELSLPDDTDQTISAGVVRGFPPHFIIDENGDATGFAIDVMDEVAARAGLAVNYRIYPSWKDAIAAFNAGEIDLFPNVGITADRDTTMAFSSPYETMRVSLFIRNDEPPIVSLADLQDRVLGAVRGNVAVNAFAGRSTLPVKLYETLEDALEALVGDEIDVLGYPATTLLYVARSQGIDTLIRQSGPSLADIERALAVRKDQTALLAVLEPHLIAFRNAPEFNRLYRKWFAPQFQNSHYVWIDILGIAAAAIILLFTGLAWYVRRRLMHGVFDAAEASAQSRLWRRMLLVSLAITAFALAAAGVTLLSMYRAAIEETRSILLESAESNANFIETIARSNLDHYGDASYAHTLTLEQLRDALGSEHGFVEAVVAEVDGANIHFLIRQHASQTFADNLTPLSSRQAEPMRRALAGEAGTIIAPDYRDETVLAAYQPLPTLAMGLVIKKDLAEIREPFVLAAATAIPGAVGLGFLGGLAYIWFTVPMMLRLLRGESQYRAIYSALGRGIIVCAPSARNSGSYVVNDLNPASARLEGHERSAWIGQSLEAYLAGGDTDALTRVLRHTWETGEPGQIPEQRHMGASGTSWREYQIYRLPFDELIIVYDDVTARKKSEAALSASEERYRELFDNAPTTIWIEDYSGLKGDVDALLASGVDDLERHLEAHESVLKELLTKIRVVDANKKAIEVYGAASLGDLKGRWQEELSSRV